MSKTLARSNGPCALEKVAWIPVIAQSELALYRYRDPEGVAGTGVALLRHASKGISSTRKRNADEGGRDPYGEGSISLLLVGEGYPVPAFLGAHCRRRPCADGPARGLSGAVAALPRRVGLSPRALSRLALRRHGDAHRPQGKASLLLFQCRPDLGLPPGDRHEAFYRVELDAADPRLRQ